MSQRRRIDTELVRRGLAATRSEAARYVAEGRVLVSGTVANKTSRLVAPAESVRVQQDGPRFVSRGGHKLDGALNKFSLNVTQRVCLDVGASTGGFTDCLLQRGAHMVYALDVGYGQLDQRLREDPRVVVMEKTHINDVDLSVFPQQPTLAVADVSFISLTRIIATVTGLLAPSSEDVRSEMVLLAKPQFEVGRAVASKTKGIIRDPAQWVSVLEKLQNTFIDHHVSIIDGMVSPIRGGHGNVEFLLHCVPGIHPTNFSPAQLVTEVSHG